MSRRRQLAQLLGDQPTQAAQPTQGQQSLPAQAATEAPSPQPYRPQPYTADMLPDAVPVPAEGAMTAAELEELGRCEAAYGHAEAAAWMYWAAVHAVRERRLYRGRDGTRTWVTYCAQVLGESESEVNRGIQQYPLMRAITQQAPPGMATPASHVQALLPVAASHSEDSVAAGYIRVRQWAAGQGVRVTAALLQGWVGRHRAAVEAGQQLELTDPSLMEGAAQTPADGRAGPAAPQPQQWARYIRRGMERGMLDQVEDEHLDQLADDARAILAMVEARRSAAAG